MALAIDDDIMPLLPARHYVSEHTRFIRELLEKKPELETVQRTGREIWWDKLPSQVQAQRDMNRGYVPQKAYVYYSLERPEEPPGDKPA
jgi:hypothetical protein